MRVVEFAFIVYPATDRQRSRAFYENVLQLTPAMSLDLPDGFWIEYEIGPHTLAIGKEPFLKPSGDGPHLARSGGLKAAIVLDPDGNKIGIHKRKR